MRSDISPERPTENQPSHNALSLGKNKSWDTYYANNDAFCFDPRFYCAQKKINTGLNRSFINE